MSRGFQGDAAERGGAWEAALVRLDRLVNLERADRSHGTPGAAAIRRVDLEPVRDLLARLGSPERRFRAVHVTGTKGKGSVAALVAEGLRRAGHVVGLYTSPHVERVNERVCVDGQPLTDAVFAAHLERALDARDAAVSAGTAAADASWFDTLTAAAFDAFAARGVTWAAVEVGLGGRLDSTNVVRGEVCVVTNIDLEHTAILGDTRAAIATEKAGIFKVGATLLTGVRPEDPEAAAPLHAAARAVGGEVEFVPQAGTMAARNQALADAALAALARRGVAVDPVPGLAPRDPGLPGRKELRRLQGVPVVLDGAHVPSSLRALLDELEGASGLAGKPVVVLGTGRDKDAAGLLKALQGRVDRVVCTSVGTGPARTSEELLQAAQRVGVEAEVVAVPADALRTAVGHARSRGWVLVTGSLHLIGAVRGHLPSATEDTACSPSFPTSS